MEEAQGFLGRVAAVAFLSPWHGWDAPDGGDLGCRIGAVYEVVVESMLCTLAFARPQERLVGVGEGGVHGVRGRVWFVPGDLIYHLELHALEGEAEAEDDVVRARDPDSSVGFEDAPRLSQPPDVELVIRFKPHGPVPGSLVDGGQASALDRNAACREPVWRVGEDHIYATRGHGLHEIQTVREVDHSSWLAE